MGTTRQAADQDRRKSRVNFEVPYEVHQAILDRARKLRLSLKEYLLGLLRKDGVPPIRRKRNGT